MKKIAVLLILVAAVFVSCNSNNQDVIAIEGLTSRVLPDYADKFVFKTMKADSTDVFELSSKGDRIVIRGNNANSMAVGLNHYLKYYCNVHVSWFLEDTINMPATLAPVPEKITISARVRDRFFLNYCTFGYTMPWWDWNDWEHFIDWMALNGINLPLAITGQEAIWYKVWSSIGLTDEEIRNYFTGPAHLPWHRMQNIDRHGGPLPHRWLDTQEELQKQIVARERELNMRPVLPGFAGHVPPEIKRVFPDAKITSLGAWCDFDTACWCNFLDPMDTLFTFIQKKFIEEEIRAYGTDHVYGIDLFNEMIPPSGDPEYLGRVSCQVYESLHAADKDAILLHMTRLFFNERHFWTNDRVEPYITSFPKDKQILLDYYCENTEVWQRTNKFFGVPYIWCYLGNFGGNTFLAGNIRTVNERIENTFKNGGYNFVGIGSTLEGFDCNPFMYEYVFEKAWDFDLHKDVDKWVERLADQRAGFVDENNRAAWKLLVDSVYNWPATPGQAPMLHARPSLEPYQYYVNSDYNYNNINLLNVLDLMLKTNTNTSAFGFDVTNITRQMLSNYFTDLYYDYRQCYYDKNLSKLQETETIMVEIFDDLELILNTQSAFLLGKWNDDARAIGRNKEESDYFERNGRDLVSTWAGKYNVLNDYGSRSWAGLVDSYYKQRWIKYFRRVRNSLIHNVEIGDEYFTATMSGKDRYKNLGYETVWYKEMLGTFSPTPTGNSVKVARQLLEKYKPLIEEKYQAE